MLQRGDIVKRERTNSFFVGVVLSVYNDLDGIRRLVIQDPVTRTFALAEETDVKVLVPAGKIPITGARSA